MGYLLRKIARLRRDTRLQGTALVRDGQGNLRQSHSLNQFNPQRKVLLRTFVVAVSASLWLLISQSVWALGIGAAEVKSALGSPLRVSIPLFNVSNPNAMQLDVSTNMFGGDPERRLNIALDRSNNQLALLVTTTWPVQEPYIQFEVSIDEGQGKLTKEVLALLEFSPALGQRDPLRAGDTAQPTGDRSTPLNAAPLTPAQTNIVSASSGQVSSADPVDILGPYEWAEPGNIPRRFGAVLDGQSLWRVARRLNQAFGVSIEQMMVALYENNPDAFYNQSVDSLKAGSYLNVPSLDLAGKYSHAQAQGLLDQLASAGGAPVLATTDDARTDQNVTLAQTDAAATTSTPAAIEETAPAAVFSIDEQPSAALLEAPTIDKAPMEISASGVQAELVDKDQVIEALRTTIVSLERDNIEKSLQLRTISERLASIEKTLDGINLNALSPETSRLNLNTDSALEQADEEPTNWLLWFIPIVGAFGAWLGFRARGGAGAHLPVWNDDGDRERTVTAPGPRRSTKHQFEEADSAFDSESDFSAYHARSADEAAGDEDPLDGVTCLEFEGEEFDQVAPLDVSQYPGGNAENPSYAELENFPKKDLIELVNTLIDDGDLDAALDIIATTRTHPLDEPTYHFFRLRVYSEMDDEHAFYEYYNQVEHSLQDAEAELKTELAQLIAGMNKSKA